MKLDSVMMGEFVSRLAIKPTANVLTLDAINEDILNRLRNIYAGSLEGQPLFAVNTRRPWFGFPFTGLLITDKGFAFKTVKNSFFSSLMPLRGGIATLPQAEVRSFQIGQHDHCFGTAYVGHECIVNGEVVGLIRMGNGIEYDETAIETVNALASFLFERGQLNKAPVPFRWQ